MGQLVLTAPPSLIVAAVSTADFGFWDEGSSITADLLIAALAVSILLLPVSLFCAWILHQISRTLTPLARGLIAWTAAWLALYAVRFFGESFAQGISPLEAAKSIWYYRDDEFLLPVIFIVNFLLAYFLSRILMARRSRVENLEEVFE